MGKEEKSVMKKNVKVLIAVIAVIVLLMGGIAALLMTDGNEAPTEPTATNTPVNQYDAYKIEREDIDSFTIRLKNENIMFKNTKNGTWSVNDTPYEQLDVSKIETLLGSVCTMMSNHEAEKAATDLSKYGLDNPQITIDIKRADGKVDKLLIGDISPTVGEYFFTVDGSGDVYTIYSYKVDVIKNPASYYKTFDRFNIKVEDITNIRMERRGMDTLELRVRDINEDDGYSVAWEIVQPYDEVFNGIDQFISDKILTPLNDLMISAPADEGVDYGFGNPTAKVIMEIVPYNEQDGTTGEKVTETLVIGNTADGLTYVQYKGDAYAVTSSDVSFAYTDAFLTVSKLQALVDIQSTDKVSVKTATDETVIDIRHGAEATDMTFRVNGADADPKASRQAYQEIISMNVDAVYNGEQMGEAEVIIEFSGYNGADDVMIELKPVNELNYALSRNGKTYFVIKKTKVNEMLEKLNEYVQNPMGK